MDDNCGEWVECMGVTSRCGEQEVGVANGSGCSGGSRGDLRVPWNPPFSPGYVQTL